MNLHQAITTVLKEADRPLTAEEIWAEIEQRNLWQTNGKTPIATVQSTLAVDIKNNGEQATFRRTDRGLFQINNPESAPDGDGLPDYFDVVQPSGEAEHEEQSGEDRIETPFDPKQIRVESRQFTIDLIIKRLNAVEIMLNPDFQRQGGIWSQEAMSRLIESLLIRIPLPAFYFDTTNEDKWVVIDGLQRLTALKRFIVDKDFKLKGLEFLTDHEGKGYDELPRSFQRRIEESQITVYQVERGTAEEVKFTIFRRINTGGLPLTTQEIRHALNQGPATVLLKELVTYEEFLKAIDWGISDERQEQRELVLRFLAFRLTRPEEFPHRKDFDWFLNEAMKRINQLPEAEIQKLRKDFRLAMRRAFVLFGKDAFRKRQYVTDRRKPINKPLFESLGGNLADLTDEQFAVLRNRAEEFRARMRDLMISDESFITAITSGTSDLRRVIYRFAAIRTVMQEVIHAESH